MFVPTQTPASMMCEGQTRQLSGAKKDLWRQTLKAHRWYPAKWNVANTIQSTVRGAVRPGGGHRGTVRALGNSTAKTLLRRRNMPVPMAEGVGHMGLNIFL